VKDPQIPVKIGIHTGDVIFDGEEIIGDGVNVASRVESLAVNIIAASCLEELNYESGIMNYESKLSPIYHS